MTYLGRPGQTEISATATTETFTGNGGTTFTLAKALRDDNASFLEVFVSNVQQQPAVSYSIVGTSLTFAEAPGAGEPIYVIFRDYTAAPIFTVPDAAITESKLSSASVTVNKIGTGAVTNVKLATDAVTAVKIADASITLSGTKVTGTLPVANGGTGTNTLTANNVIIGNGTSAVSFVAPGISGNVLASDGNTWTSTAPAAAGLSAASQAEMEAATSNTVAATPLNFNFHPSAAKSWVKIAVSSGTPSVSSSYNVASIADTATGKCTVTLTTGFSSANYVVLCSVDTGGTVMATPDVRITSSTVFFAEIVNTSNVPIDPREYFFATFGDQ